MVLLLPLAGLGCLMLFRDLSARGGFASDWRWSFILAAAAFGALVVLGTEILSLAAALTGPSVALYWLLVNAALWGGLFLWRRRAPALAGGWSFIGSLQELRTWPLDARVLLGAALLFATFLGGIALLTPTTNWDSLTYHMARVMHWIQNRSVAHYPTNMVGQIQMGPWPAFVQTHLWLLWGNDRFANFVQWSAMMGCSAVATLLVRELLAAESAEVARRAQAVTALLIVTLPTGIVESISTQTDFVAAFWLMSFAALALKWSREPGNRAYAAGFGTVMGLGAMTKFTFLIFGFPIGLATASVLLWKQRRTFAQLVLPASFALAICFALALPHFLRNQAVFGSGIGSPGMQESQGIRHVSLSGILFNVLHNAELHANTGIEPLTKQLNRLAHVLERWTGRAPDDPDLSIKSSMYEAPDEFFVFDSFAASPWQVALIGAAAIVAMARPRKQRLALLGLGLALAGLVLFCTVLRWQIWNSRYHLPVLAFSMPLAAAILVPRVPRWLACAVAAGLLAFGMVIVANNRSRPIFNSAWLAQTRLQQLISFQGVKYYQPMRLAACQIMAAGCAEVGLKLLPDTPEYPLWLMLHESGFQGKICHQFVEGPSSQLPGPAKPPDVLLVSSAYQPVGEFAAIVAKDYPTSTEIGPTGAAPVLTLYWSAKISEQREQAGKRAANR